MVRTQVLCLALALSPLASATPQTMVAGPMAPVSLTSTTGTADGAAMNCEPCEHAQKMNIPHDNEVTASFGGTDYSVSTGYTSGSTAQEGKVPCGWMWRVKYTFKNCEVNDGQLQCDTPATFTTIAEKCPESDGD